jgi:hypothetical protein
MSEAVAIGGRNAIAGAPSVPPAPAVRADLPGADLASGVSGAQAAAAVAGLCLLLVSRLDAAAGLSGEVAERAACALAARHAASVSSPLGAATPP